jgi:uncharacterized membrane protein YgcG
MCTYARIVVVSARAALAAGVVLALTATLATGARAGEYHVYSCRTPGGQPAPTEGWSEPAHSGEDVTLNTCQEAGGGLIAGMDDGYAHAAHSALDKASWRFTAPTNETIAAGKLWRAGGVGGGSNQHAYYAAYMESGPIAGEDEAFDTCTAWQPCAGEGNFNVPLAPSNVVSVPANALPSDFLSLDAACGSSIVEYGCPEGKNDPSGYAATIELFAADLVLSDTESPTVSAVGGGLAEAPTLSGHSDLAFHASDGGSGIYEVVFKVDGQVVSSVIPEEEGGRCRDVGGTSDGLSAFLYTQPCPAAVNVDLPFDTTAIANGAHHLLVSVADAAGNAKPVIDRQVTVANSSNGAGGGSGGAGSGGAGGTGGGGSSGAGGGAGGTAPSGSAAGAGSPAVAAAPNGVGASAQAILTAAWRGHGGERLVGPYGAARTVEGRLTGSGGAPIAGAQIAVDELPAYAGAKPRALPPPHTGTDGRWRLSLPRSSASGELRFSYRTHLGDPLPVATRTLTLSVRAGIELRIAPHVARSGGDIHFDGRLVGGPIPAGGKQVVLEARSPGGRWLEFHVIRARAGGGGRLRFAYRFRLPGPARYEFRVLCEAEADYPFAAGTSNVVRVYER